MKTAGRKHNRSRTTLSARGAGDLLAVILLAAIAYVVVSVAPAPAQDDDNENRYAGGAPLKTDPELESQMRRAEKFAEDKEFGYAATVWQYVLDKSGDTLMTRDGRTYTSLAEEVERALAKLPADALRVYRITADGEAKAILAQAENEEDALSEVVRRYFVSSYGDDAAYKLGCLALDRHDFVGASRMFSKIVDLHPDPSVPRADILLRLAVAGARVGDKTAAREIVGEAEKVAAADAADLVALVKREIEQATQGDVATTDAATQWPMALGGPARRGHMPALPASVMSSTLTELWGYTFPVDFSLESAGQVYSGGRMSSLRSPYSRGELVAQNAGAGGNPLARWQSQVWRPAGQLLLYDGMVMFKTNNDLSAWKARDIGITTEVEQPLGWRSAWLNAFQLDSNTQMYVNMGMQQQLGQGGRPIMPNEVMLFGDRVHHAMAIADGVVYNIEGQRMPRNGGTYSPVQQQQPQHWGVVPRRTRRNWLAAYDSKTGKALWYRGPADSDDDSAELGFLAAPVPYGKLLLVPVTDSGTIWMYALSRTDGATVWKSYLCDEPTGGCSPWSPVCVAIDGRDAYVVCGTGVVFALDAVSGLIRYAVRYERHGSQNQMMRNYGYAGTQLLDLTGWEEDVVIPYGRALVVLGSDHNRLLALDRRSGKLLWESPRTPFDHPAEYCLGAVDGAFYVGGKNVIRRYDIVSGLLKWETAIDDADGPSYGRAALTSDAIYVPVKNSIWKLDLVGGKVLGKVGVSLGTDDMVGNLYSDGERLWVHGGNRIYALTNLEHRLSLLEKRIAAKDPSALLERARLFARGNEPAKAKADLEAAHALLVAQQGAAVAAETLLGVIRELHLTDTAPRDVLQMAAVQLADLGDPAKLAAPRRQTLSAALNVIRRDKLPATEAVLAVSAQLDDDNLRAAARKALAAGAVAADLEVLRKAVTGADPTQCAVAADALARVAGASAKDALVPLLEQDDPQVQLAGARALAVLGDRTALPALLELMASEELPLRLDSSHVLTALTGERFGYVAYDKPEARQASLDKWQAWLASDGGAAPLKHPLPDTAPMLGRTLVASYQQAMVIEYDAAGKETWRLTTGEQPWSCQGLPDGHRLVAFHANGKVIEYDGEGKEVWKREGLGTNIFAAQRLDNGNTLLVVSESNQILEFKADQQAAVWQATVPNRPMDAKRLENGNTLVCCANSNEVVEIDAAGRIVWRVQNMNGPIKAQRLENGNTLVVQMNTGAVVEVERDGKEVWRLDGFSQPYDAQRLPTGGTLIVDNSGLHEYDEQRKKVDTKPVSGGSGVSRF